MNIVPVRDSPEMFWKRAINALFGVVPTKPLEIVQMYTYGNHPRSGQWL